MKLSLCLLVVCSLSRWSSATKYSRTVTYEDQLVIRCDTQSAGIESLLSHDEVDVWAVTGEHADVRLQYSLYQTLRNKLPTCTVLHANVEALVQQLEKNMEKQSKNGTWFESYHQYNEIVDWYKNLGNDIEKKVVNFVPSIGKSIEGRDQPAVHITITDENSNTTKKQIYFQCQIHAREWISGATCMYIASYLVENSEKNERVISLLKDIEFIFVPFANPDGYEYTWTNDRLWRKNRRKDIICHGVDLNRNYNDHWNEGGSSGNPCSETYHGPSAASEPETQNTVKYFMAQENIIGAIDWHSFSQLILRPNGWTETLCPDDKYLTNISKNMSDAIKAVHGKEYTPQRIIDLYKATGGASDWFYNKDVNKGKKYRAAGITIELRDTGEYGFELPPDQIIPTGDEIVEAILVFATMLNDNPIPGI